MFNKSEFKKLLTKAIGDRTMTEFAKQSGVNRTYISKYMNERLDAPPSPEILKRIANVAANNVTYLDLMKAAGYIPKELTLHFDELDDYFRHIVLSEFQESIEENAVELAKAFQKAGQPITPQELKNIDIRTAYDLLSEDGKMEFIIALSNSLKISNEKLEISMAYPQPKHSKKEEANLIGSRLKELRIKHGLSPTEFGKQIGVKRLTVLAWESGSLPGPDMIQRIAKTFAVSTDWLMGLTNDPRPIDQINEENKQRITEALKNDPEAAELLEFWEELKEREDLKLLFKQVRPLSDESIRRVIRIIKAIEDEESMEP